MRFDLFSPCEALKPFVKQFAISESEAEQVYKVLPDTGLVIGFQFKGKLFQLQQEKTMALNASGITGLNDSFRRFKNTADTGTLLVYFHEGAAASFFQQPLHELFNESLSLEHFMLRSELLILEEQLQEASTGRKKIQVVEQFLLSRINPAAPDSLVQAALALIHKSKGLLRIKELAQQLNISQSPLEKRFRQTVGTSPKKFAAIVRFKHTLQQHQSGQSLTALAYEAGFYDQAHFIKTFRQFTGETPESFFSAKQ